MKDACAQYLLWEMHSDAFCDCVVKFVITTKQRAIVSLEADRTNTLQDTADQFRQASQAGRTRGTWNHAHELLGAAGYRKTGRKGQPYHVR